MDHFTYRDRSLYCEDVPVSALAEEYGTPLFVYSEATLLHHLRQIQAAFAEADPILAYSVKTNGNLSILKLMADHGSGFDVTSGGELHRARRASATAPVVFAGVGKTEAEMRAGLDAGVMLFNVESEEELFTLGDLAKSLGRRAPVALRVNPDLPPKTHAKTDTSVKGVKFGLDIDTVRDAAKQAVGHHGIDLCGVHMHLGSPILSAEPYRAGGEKAAKLIADFRAMGHNVRFLNMGGGFGIHYRKQEAQPAAAFADAILPWVRQTGCKLVLEPGRFIAGNAGVLVGRVLFNKDTGGKHYVIQDAAMNDLIRPTLYDSFHRIWPVAVPNGVPERPDDYEADLPGTIRQDVVGPVCESGDYLAKGRNLPPLGRGELLAVFSAGAYGISMASNYNARCRAAEVLVTGRTHRLIRRRETFADLTRCEEDCFA
jgi:diaminopimelate decarboxylase